MARPAFENLGVLGLVRGVQTGGEEMGGLWAELVVQLVPGSTL